MGVLANNQLFNVEVISRLNIASGGSNSKAISNIYCYRRTSNTNTYDPGVFENAFQSSVMTVVMGALNQAGTQVSNDVRCIDDVTDLSHIFTRSLPGSITTARDDSLSTVTISLSTNYRSKGFIGKKFYCPISLADVNGDVLASGAVTNFNLVKAALTAQFTDANGNTWVPQLLSRKRSILTLKKGAVAGVPCTVVASDIVAAKLNKRPSFFKRRRALPVY